jgi:hypothetical protein
MSTDPVQVERRSGQFSSCTFRWRFMSTERLRLFTQDGAPCSFPTEATGGGRSSRTRPSPCLLRSRWGEHARVRLAVGCCEPIPLAGPRTGAYAIPSIFPLESEPTPELARVSAADEPESPGSIPVEACPPVPAAAFQRPGTCLTMALQQSVVFFRMAPPAKPCKPALRSPSITKVIGPGVGSS